MTLPKKIEEIRSQLSQDLVSITGLKDMEEIKIKYLGKKGLVASLMPELKNCSNDDRPLLGKQINELKQEITAAITTREEILSESLQHARLQNETIDVTLPGRKQNVGRSHPVIQMLDKAVEILIEMGFSVEDGPNIEKDFYNFEALNFPPDHPARDMQDTFFLSKDILLRTHTSNVQVRVMEKSTPPIRAIAPGRCFRNETVSSRSHVFFHQLEAFYIDEHVTFGDLLATMDQFWAKFFQRKIETRYRPSFFPFVEPGLEGDIKCTVCSGKGCRICKHTGWLEVIGAGMIHPEVLKNGGIDPEKYSGYAWGLGIERLAMLFYDMRDIRTFTENDMRFLSQFP